LATIPAGDRHSRPPYPPEAGAEVEVSDDDLEVVIAAQEWFEKVGNPMMIQHKGIIERRYAAREAADKTT
jgi:hypothetical protein